MPAARVQKIVLDFDGARINAGTVFGPDMQATLSPLAAFLPKWGLTKADLRPLAAQIGSMPDGPLRPNAARARRAVARRARPPPAAQPGSWSRKPVTIFSRPSSTRT